MRRFYLVAILLASVGCERIEPDQTQSPLRPTEETPALMKVHARVDETRTSLGGPRGTEVRWSAGDAIALWGEDSPACRRYAIDDRFAGGTSADFTGEAFESAVYYACYPYRPDAVAEGAGVTTTLPAVQPFGGSGTFAAGISPMTARSTRADDLRFTSVCGVVRLQLTGTATIRSIRLTALDGAPLAGRMRFEWTAAGGWTIRSVDAGHPSILLDCGAGGAALSGGDPVVFCLVVPPGSYRGWRFTITDTEGGQMVRETSQAEVVLAANHIKTYNPIAYAATEPAPVALDASATANCYVVARAGRYEFDATTMGNGAVTPPDAAYTAGSTCGKADGIVPEALRPVTAKLLWQTAPNLIGEVSLGEEGRIRFTTADPFVEGNAVVAACDADGAILWSWHLWLTSADLEGSLHRYALPYEGLGAAAVMDRNLGALAAAWQGSDNVSSYGMFYQWGRKDPFVPFRSSQERMAVYDAAGAELADDSAASAAFDAAPGWHLADGERLGAAATMEAAVRYPMNFITEIPESTGASYPNWYYVAAGDRLKDDLWGCTDALSDVGAKSIYDPCPPGYRVSHRFVWTAFAPTADAPFSQWYKQGTSVSAKDGLVFTVEGQEIYYPAAGMLFGTTGAARFTKSGWYVWSASPYAPDSPKAGAFVLETIQKKLLGSAARSCGAQVRCMRE